ncbi:MAG: lipoprotein insertase outer membrane protein LolB [Gammaproteobacteria bacterium]|nr:lipoprotein insertase outer membrane protein LolB [Gammaproteobacteria bacterium]
MKRCAWLILCVGLGACATAPPPLRGPAPAPATHITAVQALVDWSLAGRIGIQAGDHAWTASLRWREQGAAYRIRFVGPLGQGSALLRGGPGGVELSTSRGEHYQAADAATLLADHLGWHLPVQALGYWVRGVPQPGPDYRLRLGSDGRIAGFRQSGWDVDVAAYRRVAGIELPTRLRAYNGRLQVRLAVEQWTIPAAAMVR